jgi:hypothetical protein|tara:strand:+ start:1005 stop:1253 length:249 start_codon:yes stop_codon:yes gene_type:complete
MAKEGRKNNKEDKKEDRSEKVSDKRSYRLEKIKELTAKAYAVATKRKWLVFMIGAAIAAYLIIFKGGFSFGGGWLDKIKGLF